MSCSNCNHLEVELSLAKASVARLEKELIDEKEDYKNRLEFMFLRASKDLSEHIRRVIVDRRRKLNDDANIYCITVQVNEVCK